MIRQRALKIVLVLFGLLFVAATYPMVAGLGDRQSEGDNMMLSIYVTLGIFLLLASRRPSLHRSLIAFAGWANVAHATVMSLMAMRMASERRGLLIAAVSFGAIGITLIALIPAKESPEHVAGARAG